MRYKIAIYSLLCLGITNCTTHQEDEVKELILETDEHRYFITGSSGLENFKMIVCKDDTCYIVK